MKSLYKTGYTYTSGSTSASSKNFNFTLQNILVFMANLYTTSAQISSGSSSYNYSYVYVTINNGARTSYGGKNGTGTQYMQLNQTFDSISSGSSVNLSDLLYMVSPSQPLFLSSLKMEGTFYDGYNGASSRAIVYYIQM